MGLKMATEYTNELNGTVVVYPQISVEIPCESLEVGHIFIGSIQLTDGNGNLVGTAIDTITTAMAYLPNDPTKTLKATLNISFEEV